MGTGREHIKSPSALTEMLDEIERLKASPEYRNYLYARERVLLMKSATVAGSSGANSPSQYWMEELAQFGYMFDASPLIIQKLRHHTFHITGLRVYEYRTHKDRGRAQLARKLEVLRALDKDNLLVPEHPALGGFGFEIDGHLYNTDTLKFYEVLIGLSLSGALKRIRNGGRKLVWEIGAGWGGFAYQFKTLFPDVTYMIMDLPEVMLFSAVYLKTIFPAARVLMYGDVPESELFENWEGYDFIFLPHTYLDRMSAPPPDLTVNMVSFQEMTERQVDAYVRKAMELKCPFIYSLNRKRSLYNTEIKDVGAILAKYYNVKPVEVLDVDYNYPIPPPNAKAGKLRMLLRNVLKRLPLSRTDDSVTCRNKMSYQHLRGKLKR